VITNDINGKPMLSCCFEYIDAARFHGWTSLVCIETAPGHIAFFASVAGPTPKGPGLVIAVEKNSTFKNNDCIIESIHHLVIFCPVKMKEKRV
jgi:hypothetical protein